MAELKSMQANAVKKLLNLNADTTAGSGGWGEQWKLLIYDRFCRDVISPLINVAELRKQGITLHMLLDSEREEIPDVPCVYFVTPTAANVARIAKDCAARLYTSVHLNFASPLPRPLLEELAKTSVAADAVSAITKVWDQALDYVCLEPRLFTLNQPDSYVAFNDPAASEAALAAWTSRIVQGLFSALATLGVLPIIRAPKGGAAEHIATRLHEMLRAHTQGRSSLFASGTASSSSSASASSHDSFARPVLVLLQRDHDLVTAVHHTATYQALVDDLLSLKMNRVTFEAEEGGRSVRKSYDLDPANDAFYAAYGGREFPAAIEANAEQLAGVAQREAAIRAGGAQGAAGLGGAAAAGGGGGGGAGGGGGQGDIMAAVTSLPALLEKKKMLEQHTAILQGTMDLVMAREVPTLHEVCESMVRTSYADKAKLLEVLAGPGTLRDKVRVLVVAYVATEGLAAADMEELEAAVGAALTASQPAPAPGPDGAPAAARAPIDLASVPEMKVLSYIKKYKQDAARMRLVKAGSMGGSSGGAAAGASATSAFSTALSGKFMNGLTSGAQGLLAKAAAGVKGSFGGSKQSHATKVVSAICEDRDSPETEEFLYLDPKIQVARGQAAPRHRGALREAVVFMIGGGNYTEYQNLQAYAQTQQEAGIAANVTYGCTELLNAEAMLEQLAKLG